MSEKKELTQHTEPAEKPKKLWDGALKMVRGDNTSQLIENFTAEMTLVAEGLCEDQSILRREVDRMITEEDRRAHDRDVTELRNRLAALEKQASHKPVKEKTRRGNIIRDLTVLVAIAAGAWIIVTIINKFF